MLYLGVIYLGQPGDEFKNFYKGIATLKEALKIQNRFASQIANILANIYGNTQSNVYNLEESQKQLRIAKGSENLGNVR